MAKNTTIQSPRKYAARMTDHKDVPYLCGDGSTTAYGVPAFATRWGFVDGKHVRDAYQLSNGEWVWLNSRIPAAVIDGVADYNGAPAHGHAWCVISDAWFIDRHASETKAAGAAPVRIHIEVGRVTEIRADSMEGDVLATWETDADEIAAALSVPYVQPMPWEPASIPGPAPLRSGYERLGRKPVAWAA